MALPYQSFVDVVQSRSVQFASEKAFIFLEDGVSETDSITFGELDEKARSLAGHLYEQGYQDSKAMLIFPPGLDFIIAFMGCLYARVIVVPVQLPGKNKNLDGLENIVKDAAISLILTNEKALVAFDKNRGKSPVLSSIPVIKVEEVNDDNRIVHGQFEIQPDDLAFIQYTSGSTSEPKGVMISHNNVLDNVTAIRNAFGIAPGSTSVCWLPFYHDMGLIGNLFGSVFVCVTCVLMPPLTFMQSPQKWLHAITRYKANVTGAPNFGFDLCVDTIADEDLDQFDLSSLELVYNGAEPVKEETLRRFTDKFRIAGFRYEAFYPCYGMAETTLFVTGEHAGHSHITVDAKILETEKRVVLVRAGKPGARTLVGCGNTYNDHEVAIVDTNFCSQLADGIVGEIWVSGQSNALGYWNKPELIDKAFNAHIKGRPEKAFLRTGDHGFYYNGSLFITGRIKDLVIIRGRNYYPQDIELTTEKAHEAIQVAGVAAFSVSSGRGEKVVVLAEIKRTAIRNIDEEEVFASIRRELLSKHELDVRDVVLVRPFSLPKTTSGKVRRFACREAYQENSLSEVATYAPGERSDITEEVNHQSPEPVVGYGPIVAFLREKIAAHNQVNGQSVDVHAPLEQYGLDSLAAVKLSGELSRLTGMEIQPTIVYDYPSISQIASYLTGEEGKTEKLLKPSTDHSEPIAIVGMQCRFPGAEDINAYKEILSNGTLAIKEVTLERWNTEEHRKWLNGNDPQSVIFKGGFLEGIDQFDADFFGITPREARNMDPQQRLLLEVSWEALENAGIATDTIPGKKAGVYIGISSNDYAQFQENEPGRVEPHAGTGNALSIAANRISYVLDLRGPSMAIDTACSSSLVAVHQACQSLRNGECEMALAGGVNLILDPKLSEVFNMSGMLAGDARCKTLDATADGYVRGEGCGIVVLKRLSDALADGDKIEAVIGGSALNQDGRSNGLTAPNGPSQQAVIKEALRAANTSVDKIGYFEIHGSGTSLGDPIEINSLAFLFRSRKEISGDHPRFISTAKTNIGHLEAAAGIAGLIKAVLSLKHQTIFPHINFSQLNPAIDISGLPSHIPETEKPFEPQNGDLRRAGVSAFGFGGTNAHVILQEYVAESTAEASADLRRRSHHVVTLSARSEAALT
ncbi:MAG: beta-ketoacyl synthase N-terminal-like domain-containing protein, partial [Cyclobacteriaceae bacterium]